MSAGNEARSSTDKRSAARRGTGPADPPQRRGFNQPGRTKVERNKDLPVERQIRALLKNPTPSPAEQNRLCELTHTKSYRAAVGVAKRMLVPPAPPPEPVAQEQPVPRRSNRR